MIPIRVVGYNDGILAEKKIMFAREQCEKHVAINFYEIVVKKKNGK